MKNYTDLEPDQLDCIDFILDGEDSLICADVGTGKTVISMTAASEVEGTRWLVLAPLMVAENTWAEEHLEWEHLQDLEVALATGTADERIAAIESDADFVIMNYENLEWLMEQYPKPRKGKPETLPFDGLIADEIDKLKSVSSNRFKSFRNRINIFQRRIGLTGTVMPNDLTELWGQVYMVDGGESFGRSFYKWREEYFYPTDFNRYKWAPFPDTYDYILDRLSDITFRLKAKGLPEVMPMIPAKYDLPKEALKRYKELEKEFLLCIDDDTGHLRTVEAANAAVLKGKLMQITAGFSYVDGTKEAVWHSKRKFQWLDELWEVMGTKKQLLIVYHFQEELEELKRRHPDMPYIGKGVSKKRANQFIRSWNLGHITRLAIHPASAGHGLNLQKAGASDIAVLTWPWSGGLYKQFTGRLARRGNPSDIVKVHTALFYGTVDLEVFGTVYGKVSRLDQFLDDLEAATAGKVS